MSMDKLLTSYLHQTFIEAPHQLPPLKIYLL